MFALCSIIYGNCDDRPDVRLACNDGQSHVERAGVARLAAGEYQSRYRFYEYFPG